MTQNTKKQDKNEIGLTVTKSENFSEWYTQTIVKAGLIEYTDVAGCIVFRPRSYELWEAAQKYLDTRFKELGVQNAYFPLFIPESYLKKEEDHVEGFTPEVAWVTHTGTSELSEKLAVRPTSETIMYPSYAKWIQSHRDLPLKLNQWCSVVRWEFKHPVPFLRTREFLWQEGHTAFATKAEADQEVLDILDVYASAFEDLMAVPVMKGTKSEKERFAGGDYTTSVETFLPNGKAIQGATSHHLGQNFAKVFNLSFLDEDGKKKRPYQNSWGFTTRSLGIMIMMHGDDKGLVIPPRLARQKVVMVPIVFEKTKDAVLGKMRELTKQLSEFNAFCDDREGYSSGWKYNEWELKGIPLRIELGPRDLEKEHVVMVRRDTGEKQFVKWHDLKKVVADTLEQMQVDMLNRARKSIDDNTVEVTTFDELKKAIDNKQLARAVWCGVTSCEEEIKDGTGGAKTLNMPFDQKNVSGKCVNCGHAAKTVVYFAKSY